jgi:atypical dual specificity phosphatase
VSWDVRGGAVTALLGPAGVGKSTLLRGLTGRAPAPGIVLGGRWSFDGGPLHAGEGPPSEIAWVPQARTRDGADGGGRLELQGPARVVLLDEPTRHLDSFQVDALVTRLRALGPQRSAVIVTHDLDFARRVADDVCLLCAGRVLASGDAAAFFAAPPDPLSERFVRQGNCWPQPLPPRLPSHFHWVLPSRLAGMGRPGLLNEAHADLEAVAAAGVTLLVSLTEEAYPAAELRSFGIVSRHFPIADMGVPAIGPTASLCREIEAALAQGRAVAVHCRAGMGRTGTILAAVLAWMGADADEAVARVRAIARGYIQNRAQLDFVRRFRDAVGRPRETPSG